MKKFFFAFFLSLIAYLLSLNPVSADVSCTPIYGGGQSCVQTGNIRVNKTVCKPNTDCTKPENFVETLGLNDPRFSPDMNVTFQIVVTNATGSQIGKITVVDTFPQYVGFVSGVGNFDPNTKKLTFEVLNLAANESRTFTVVGKVVPADQLPIQDGALCVVNQVTASTDTVPMAADNAQMCIQKTVTTKGGLKVFPAPAVTTTPSTGPEALALFGLIPAGLLGNFLKKKSQIVRGGESK